MNTVRTNFTPGELNFLGKVARVASRRNANPIENAIDNSKVVNSKNDKGYLLSCVKKNLLTSADMHKVILTQNGLDALSTRVKNSVGRPKKVKEASLTPKNPVGRPKKEKVEFQTAKNPVGRPKKEKLEVKAKNPVGRPRIHKEPILTIKNPVGRPKKFKALDTTISNTPKLRKSRKVNLKENVSKLVSVVFDSDNIAKKDNNKKVPKEFNKMSLEFERLVKKTEHSKKAIENIKNIVVNELNKLEKVYAELDEETTIVKNMKEKMDKISVS